jgi:hypothetical protein
MRLTRPPHPKSKLLSFIAAAAFGLILCSLLSAADQPTWLEHRPPVAFTPGEKIVLTVDVREKVEWLSAFYRVKGETDFLSISFSQAGENKYIGKIDVSSRPPGEIEYYLTVRQGDAVYYFPEKSPEDLYRIPPAPQKAGPEPGAAATAPEKPQAAGAPSAETASSSKPFPLSLDGSVDVKLMEKNETPGENAVHYQANLGLHYRDELPALAWAVDSRLSYTDAPLTGADKFDLAQLRLEVSSGGHTFRAGDISVAETEFSISGLGRRGVEYVYDRASLYFHAFTLNTQQLQGFKGFGLPQSGASIFGGAAGFSLADKLFSFKAVYLTGKDDPAMGINDASASWIKPREGTVFSFLPELRMFNGAFHLTSELALSHIDRDTTDAEPAQKGLAWRVNGKVTAGGFDVDGYARRVDKNFDTIGQPFLTADRQGYGLSAAFATGAFRLNGSYRDEKTTGSEDPLEVLSSDRRVDAGVSVALGGQSSFRLGYNHASQEATQNNQILPAGALSRNGANAALDVRLGPAVAFRIDGQWDAIASDQAPDKEGQSLSVGGGGSFGDGRILSLSPGIRFSRVRNPQTQEETKTFNAFVNGRLAIVPDWISLNAAGSYNDISLPGGVTSAVWMIDGGLCLESGRLLGTRRLGLSLRGSLRSGSTQGGASQNDYRLYLRFDCAI